MGKQVWRPINRPSFGVVDAISEHIRNDEWKFPGYLTPVDDGPTMLVACDYAGDHAKSRFQALSFLVADLKYLWYWEEVRCRLRRTILRDGRCISYKKLGSDKRRAKALVPFLRASNSIPGALITFLIDKRIETLFHPDSDPEAATVIDRKHWGAKPFGKLLRISHLSSLLISGFVGERQNVLMISDRDEIVPNDARHIEACKLMEKVLAHYLNCEVGRLQFATTRSDAGSMRVEDAVSLPDLAAGALAEIATSLSISGAMSANEVLTPMSRHIPKKAQTLTAWLAESHYTLKKMAFVLDFVPPGGFILRLLRIFPETPTPEFNMYHELNRRLRRN